MNVTKIEYVTELWILTLCLETSKVLVLQTEKTQWNAVCIVRQDVLSLQRKKYIILYNSLSPSNESLNIH